MNPGRVLVLCLLSLVPISEASATVFLPQSSSVVRTKRSLTFQRVGKGLYQGFVRSALELERVREHLQEQLAQDAEYSLAYCVCRRDRAMIAVAYNKLRERGDQTAQACRKLARLFGGCVKRPEMVAISNMRQARKRAGGSSSASQKHGSRSEISRLFANSMGYEKRGDNDSALKAVLKVLEIDENNYTASLRSGWLYYREDQHKESVEQYEKAISLKPDAVEPKLGLLLPLNKLRRWKELESSAREALKCDPTNFSAASSLATALQELHKPDEARRRFRTIEKLYPSSFIIQRESDRKIKRGFTKSLEMENKGDLSSALDETLKILVMEERNYPANLRAGWLYYRLGNYPRSAAKYRKAHTLARSAVEPLAGLLLPLVASKRWKEAITVAKEALSVDQQNYTANSCMAFALFSVNKYKEALRHYNKITKLYPSDAEMQLGLAWTWFRLGNMKLAHQWFTKVLQVKPANKSAIQGMQLIVTGM